MALGLVALQPEGHGAKAKPGDAEARTAEFDVLHAAILGADDRIGQPAPRRMCPCVTYCVDRVSRQIPQLRINEFERSGAFTPPYFSGSEFDGRFWFRRTGRISRRRP
jgi:hypothetical protein